MIKLKINGIYVSTDDGDGCFVGGVIEGSINYKKGILEIFNFNTTLDYEINYFFIADEISDKICKYCGALC